MIIKKALTTLLIALLLYWGIGLLLMRTGMIRQLYLYPGKSIKNAPKNTEKPDISTVGPDGPVIVRNGDELRSYAILPGGSSLLLQIKNVRKTDTLSCYIAATRQHFYFRLKDSIRTEPNNYAAPSRLLALSDIDGNFKRFYDLLYGTGVIDQQMNWTFGSGHLVLNGDFFDRGLNVTECLWLAYKLEDEARAAGGKVHFILGNHDAMNLKGRFKYVRNKYRRNADTLNLPYTQWYAENTELGKWLRSKNCVEQIGDHLFVHGGISDKVTDLQLSIQQINDIMRSKLRSEKNVKDQYDTLLCKDGPLRYRGIVQKKASQAAIDRALAQFGVKKMIIGHTPVPEICYLYQRKIIAIDAGGEESMRGRNPSALLIENKECFVIDAKGAKRKIPDR